MFFPHTVHVDDTKSVEFADVAISLTLIALFSYSDDTKLFSTNLKMLVASECMFIKEPLHPKYKLISNESSPQ